jgi:shikimate kinase
VKLEALMEIRAPLYAQLADVTVVTDNRRVRYVAEDILRELDAVAAGR